MSHILESALNKKVDIVPLGSFETPIVQARSLKYIQNV